MEIHVRMNPGETVRTTERGISLIGADGKEIAFIAFVVPVVIASTKSGALLIPDPIVSENLRIA